MKNIYAKEVKSGENVSSTFMIMKKLFRDKEKTIAYIGDKSGDVKASIADSMDILKVGDVIKVKGVLENIFEIKEFKKIEEFLMEDYLPYVNRPIEDIMNELEEMSQEEFKSKECMELNNYFFSNKEFVEKFKKGIGGVSQHHNYIGGLAEHTLNVMYLTKMLAYRYNARNKEIAILAAKLHDIGKTVEYFVDGPFSFTLRGEMEGHIVIGVQMLEEAFSNNPDLYSEDFKERIKGCVVQHHGKLEYGSPKKPNTEEAHIVHFADQVDAFLNKIGQIREGVEPNTWSDYDRRIEGKIYV
ncbi:HD domain-containing protein [Clostridium aciditolerans]|uniref:HD domain-containing protein n=1 Tax=Clostridium aciditolerans TaxID=339861 RepID=A0A934HQH4_9CLOT|nr:HD domain-containing protein [Clostridium aciditolerans]MBI6872601.1 HD domain-containing protein [Clostridium aciditolerans]